MVLCVGLDGVYRGRQGAVNGFMYAMRKNLWWCAGDGLYFPQNTKNACMNERVCVCVCEYMNIGIQASSYNIVLLYVYVCEYASAPCIPVLFYAYWGYEVNVVPNSP